MTRQFFQPRTLKEALECRRNHMGSILLAGGTDIVVDLHKDRLSGGDFIDLSKIDELKEIKAVGNEILIGSMVTFTSIQDSQILNEKADILCSAAGFVGAPQIRNKGTIGGNICNASPAADLVPPLVCMNARVMLKSMDENNCIQSRMLTVEEFIIGSNKTMLKENEILTSIIVALPSENTKMVFKKIGRRNALAISRLNGACMLQTENNHVTCISLVLGSATQKPERFRTVEDYLSGKELTDDVLKHAGKLASDFVLSKAGMRASSNYKLPVIARFTESLIEEVLAK